LPELAGPRLFHESFDAAYRSGMTDAELAIAGFGTLRESWSGYALQRRGRVAPFIVPALEAKGRLQVACDTGAVRFWLTPDWTSRSLGGAGPGTEARLCELVVADAREWALVWSLQATPDGSTLVLIAEDEAGPVALLRTEIAWAAQSPHCLTLNYGSKGTALFIDGRLSATGDATLAVPPTVAALVVGSTLAGTAPADGEIDELCAFGRPLSQAAVQFHYAMYRGRAAQGPVSAAEWAAQREAAAKRQAEREAALAATEASEPQTMLLLGGASACLTNVPVHLTNIVCAFDTNLGWTVTFDIQGGTNGLLYDVFTTTNLSGNSITNSPWTWLERGPTCSTYQYTNQPGTYAFFVLGTPQDSDGDGLTDAFERLVSKTDPNNADTDGDGLSDGWEYWNRLNPLVDDSGQQSSRANYTYDGAGWLRTVFGSRGEGITIDPEGNVTQVSQ
jgi:hypothetical protein